jgi:hypothetical protein
MGTSRLQGVMESQRRGFIADLIAGIAVVAVVAISAVSMANASDDLVKVAPAAAPAPAQAAAPDEAAVDDDEECLEAFGC